MYNPRKSGAHTHFQKREACFQLKRLLKLGIRPKQDYFLTSAERLLSKKEFKRLKEVE